MGERAEETLYIRSDIYIIYKHIYMSMRINELCMGELVATFAPHIRRAADARLRGFATQCIEK